MSLTPGSRLGPYEIQAPIGRGGMGEVFRAKDTRLDRSVAIKVLSSHVDPRRFELEARAVSGLNHPNICALYDVGQHDGGGFLVMEYLEGETLGRRLKKGPLPAAQAMRIAREIAEALDHAHRRGVVHRDLKPGNVMLMKAGSPVCSKLLDFGLALMLDPEGTDETESLPLTAAGAVVGTPRYMAPEQLDGRRADARSDIFAFGLMLKELFTDPAPPAIEQLRTRCLEHDPEERWQSARDLRAALDLARTPPPTPDPAPVPATLRDRRLQWMAGGIALAAATAVLAAILWTRREPVRREAVTFTFAAPEKHTFVRQSGVPSPDGRRIAFVASDEVGKSTLWVRSLETQAARQLAGTEGASAAFWSPDGQFLGFFAAGKLKKIALAGGPPQNLCNAVVDKGAAWGRFGDIIVASSNRLPLHRISSAGGVPQPITTLNAARQENSHRWPHFLPDGRHFLFTARSSLKENTAIYVGSLDSRETRRLLTAQSNAQYAPPGYILFGRDATLMAQRFDADRLELRGEPFPIVGGIGNFAPSAIVFFAVSTDGSTLSYREEKSAASRLTWFDRAGAKLGPIGPEAEYMQPRISPDGKRIAVVLPDKENGNRDIWLIDTASGALTRFTSHPANDWFPVWSPDGTAIAFASDRGAKSSVFRKALNGGGEEEMMGAFENDAYPWDWSSDGRLLVVIVSMQKANNLWLLRLPGRKPSPLVVSEFTETEARFSPSGEWMAYTSEESGGEEIYVTSVGKPGKVRISTNGGRFPHWRRDGKELFYITPASDLVAVEVRAGGAFETAAPRPLFTACSVTQNTADVFDVSPDGKRFLVNCRIPEAEPNAITVAIEWSPR